MRQNFTLCFLLALATILNSCHKSPCCIVENLPGSWDGSLSFSGVGRTEAASFVIGDFAYLTTGIDRSFNRYNDLWQFDPVKLFWTQKANLPGNARNSAIGMSIGSKGYVGTGYDGLNMLKDFWQYDPSTNSWTQKADFAGTGRYDAVAFSIGNYGWIGTGYDNTYSKDFFRYDPSSDTWTPEIIFPGQGRMAAVSFVYNDSAYLLTGQNGGILVGDFWRFDPNLTDSFKWRQLRPIYNSSVLTYDDGYVNIERDNGVAFVINDIKSGDRAYITTGINNTNQPNATWAYIFGQDIWYEVAPFKGETRQGAVGFTVDNRGFVATGLGMGQSLNYLNEVWEFKPDE